MWHNCKPFWEASIKDQNQIVFSITLKKDVYFQQSTKRLGFEHTVLLAVYSCFLGLWAAVLVQETTCRFFVIYGKRLSLVNVLL